MANAQKINLNGILVVVNARLYSEEKKRKVNIKEIKIFLHQQKN